MGKSSATIMGELDNETALRYAAIMLDPSNYIASSMSYPQNTPAINFTLPSDCIAMHPQQHYPSPFDDSGSDFYPQPVSNAQISYSPQTQRKILALFDDITDLPDLVPDKSMDSLMTLSTLKSDIIENDDTCCNCGLQGQNSTIVPCGHPVCRNCVNTLVNSVCNDGGPENPTCFLCAMHVERVQPPQMQKLSYCFTSDDSIDSSFNHSIIDTPSRSLSKFEREAHNDWISEPNELFNKNAACISPTNKTKGIPGAWPVIRIDNVATGFDWIHQIPWDLQISELENWLPKEALISIDEQAISMHIICSRYDGRTLSHAYVEIRDLSIARLVVREKNGTKLRFRPVSVVLSSQKELLAHIFPSYQAGFNSYGPRVSETSHLVSQGELDELLKLCKLESPHALKAPERPFLNLASICAKYPWDHKLYSPESTKKMVFNALRDALQNLISLRDSIQLWRIVGEILVRTIVDCPAFKPEWKSEIFSSCDENKFKEVANNKSPSAYVFSDWRNRKHDDKSFISKLVDVRKSPRKSKFSPTSISSSKSDCTDGYDSTEMSGYTYPEKSSDSMKVENSSSASLENNQDIKSTCAHQGVSQASPGKLLDISRDLGVDEKLLVKILKRLDIAEN